MVIGWRRGGSKMKKGYKLEKGKVGGLIVVIV
jgi:hypothetical protein